MPTHLAVAIVARHATDALAQARALPAQVTLVEYRLDMMQQVDVPRLAAETPLPAIFTCRPVAQGGQFSGSEAERRHILQQALATPHLVDVELDTLPALHPFIRHPQQVIGSQHDFAGMLKDWETLEKQMRTRGAGIAKLVGMAATVDDVLSPLTWLARATQPGIAIAMGPAGVATRLLAPRFPAAFLTFASLATRSAPGQVPVTALIHDYGFEHIARAHPLLVIFTPQPVPWEQVQRFRQALTRHIPHPQAWLLPLPVTQISPPLLQALRLARVAGAFRLPGVNAVGPLQNIVAWDLTSSQARTSSEFLSPRATLAFFSQGL